jgi:hypothetical protein
VQRATDMASAGPAPSLLSGAPLRSPRQRAVRACLEAFDGLLMLFFKRVAAEGQRVRSKGEGTL